MSAPSIPNLATLRGRTGLRGRGRGRGRPPPIDGIDTETPEEAISRKDQIVQQTDGDAASSRMSAVALGYLRDPYAAFFAPSPPPRRYPLINRGTYVRTLAIDRLVDAFLQEGKGGHKQIISLGAGSDTRFFRFSGTPGLIYHEIDFAENTVAKITKTLETPTLRSRITSDASQLSTSSSKDKLITPTLSIHPMDLRILADQNIDHPPAQGLRRDFPTLILSECCLTYLPLEQANSILRHILTTWLEPSTPTAVVLYEPIKPDDPFGQTMTSNLASRGIDMPSVRGLPTLSTHRSRLAAIGLNSGAGARTVADIYSGKNEEAWISDGERERVERLEWLDEVEEWNLLAGHYCVAWGWRDGTEGKGSIFSEAWKHVQGARRADEDPADKLHEVAPR